MKYKIFIITENISFKSESFEIEADYQLHLVFSIIGHILLKLNKHFIDNGSILEAITYLDLEYEKFLNEKKSTSSALKSEFLSIEGRNVHPEIHNTNL